MYIQGKGVDRMIIYKNTNEGWSKDDIEVKTKMIDSSIINMEHLLNKLSEKVEHLPKVNKKDSLKDDTVENLYAEKEEAVDTVVKELSRLQGFGGIVDKKIARCAGNLNQLGMDANSLHLGAAKEKYKFAKLSQEFNHKKAIQQKKDLQNVVSWAKKVLDLARSKKFPGRKPKKKFQPPPEFLAALAGVKSTGPQNPGQVSPFVSTPSSNSEMNNLISLGPLGGRISNNNISVTGV